VAVAPPVCFLAVAHAAVAVRQPADNQECMGKMCML
jgi:hypothetical protein